MENPSLSLLLMGVCFVRTRNEIFQVGLGGSESLWLNIKRVTSTVLRRNSKHRLFYVCPSSSNTGYFMFVPAHHPKRTTFPDKNSNQVRPREQRSHLFGVRRVYWVHRPLVCPVSNHKESPTITLPHVVRYSRSTPATEEFRNKHTQMKRTECVL